MKKKEQAFCYHYSRLQNHREAAIKSGFRADKAESIGFKLLDLPEVREEIERILESENKSSLKDKLILGLKRLAFGSINDAVKIILDDKIDELDNISGLDFFNVSEIKKVKGGGFEIKFFDRMKALEKLLEISQEPSKEEAAADFFEAIKRSAQALGEEEDHRESEDE